MDDKIKRLLKVYSELDYDRRKAVREFITNFETKEYPEKKSISETLNKSLGPLMSNSCPYCGK